MFDRYVNRGIQSYQTSAGPGCLGYVFFVSFANSLKVEEKGRFLAVVLANHQKEPLKAISPRRDAVGTAVLEPWVKPGTFSWRWWSVSDAHRCG